MSVSNSYGTVEMAYNSRNFVTSRTDGEGYTTRKFYDRMGNLTSYCPPVQWEKKEGGYEYRRDFLERVVVIGFGLYLFYQVPARVIKTPFHAAVRVTDADAVPVRYRVITYAYDSQGNKTEEAYGQQEVEKGGEPESWHRIHFSYDPNNHLTLVRDDFGAQMRYDYDCLGNVTLEERVIAEGVRSIIHYGYNKNGWRVRRTEEIQGNGPIQAAVTRYSYDANGNLTKIITPKGFEIRRSYDADDRLTEERIIDKKNGIDRREQYAYDEAGNVLKRTILGTDGERLELNSRYDQKDRVTHRINPAGAVTRYFYDRNNKLLKEVRPYGYEPESDDGAGTTYAYDSRGNRIRITNALGETVRELTYNLQNRPAVQKDAFGNRIQFSYGLDGKVRDIRRLGDGNWNTGTGDGNCPAAPACLYHSFCQ